MPEYSLNELATLADVTPRTVRFYIEQGLLPAPASLGPKSRYTDEHLERLRLIKQMQASGMPLATIRAQLRSMGAQDIADTMQQSHPHRASESAVDYIRDVLGTGPAPRAPATQPAPATPSAPAARSVPARPPRPTAGQPATSEPDLRSQWDRVGITPDIEIHIRRPMTRMDQKLVYRLIEYARQLFREE
jgi:DNA-binding transcriptional MerR regulator